MRKKLHTWFYCWTSSKDPVWWSPDSVTRSRMVDRLVGAGGTLDSAWGLRHETSSIALLVWYSATRDAKLKFIDYWSSSDCDRFAGEEVDQSGSLLAACFWCNSLLLPAFFEQMSITRMIQESSKVHKSFAIHWFNKRMWPLVFLDFQHFMILHKRSRDGKPPLYSLSSFSL